MIASKWLESFQNGHSRGRLMAQQSTAAPASHQSHRRRHHGRRAAGPAPLPPPEAPEAPETPEAPEVIVVRAADIVRESRSPPGSSGAGAASRHEGPYAEREADAGED